MKHTDHECPRCGKRCRCVAPYECLEAKTTDVRLLCEECARGLISKGETRAPLSIA
jgi:hypothetical protein